MAPIHCNYKHPNPVRAYINRSMKQSISSNLNSKTINQLLFSVSISSASRYVVSSEIRVSHLLSNLIAIIVAQIGSDKVERVLTIQLSDSSNADTKTLGYRLHLSYILDENDSIKLDFCHLLLHSKIEKLLSTNIAN